MIKTKTFKKGDNSSKLKLLAELIADTSNDLFKHRLVESPKHVFDTGTTESFVAEDFEVVFGVLRSKKENDSQDLNLILSQLRLGNDRLTRYVKKCLKQRGQHTPKEVKELTKLMLLNNDNNHRLQRVLDDVESQAKKR